MLPVNTLMPIVSGALHTLDVVFEWLLTYSIHSTLLIGGLLLLTSTSVGRRIVAGHGTWLWRFALVHRRPRSAVEYRPNPPNAA